jgi:hypothetical protein
VGGNYTWSHCIDTGYTEVIQTNGVQLPERRGANRGNCELDRRHNFNMSTVYETPQFSNTALRILGTGWRVSGIVRVLSGAALNVALGTDQALTATTDQRPNQVLANPYAPNKSVALWLNPAAFTTPQPGTFGNLPRNFLRGPTFWQADIVLSKDFRFANTQGIQLRFEMFNVANRLNYENPALNLPNTGTPGVPFTDTQAGTFGYMLGPLNRTVGLGTPRQTQLSVRYTF